MAGVFAPPKDANVSEAQEAEQVGDYPLPARYGDRLVVAGVGWLDLRLVAISGSYQGRALLELLDFALGKT
jgi:hypothetical protein